MENKNSVKVVEDLISDFHHMSVNMIEADTYGFSKGRDWGITSSKEEYKTYMDKEFKTINRKIDSLPEGDTKTAFKNKFRILFNKYSIMFFIALILYIIL